MAKKLKGGEKMETAEGQKEAAAPEGAEGQRSPEYNDILREMGEAQVLGSESALVEVMRSDGCQELIQTYGPERFSQAVRDTAPDWGNFSVYEIIKNLEPDRQKRLELYSKMKGLINDNEAKFNEDNAAALKAGDEAYQKNQDIYGHSFNGEKNLRKTHVENFEYLDKMPPAVSKLLLKFSNLSGILTANLSEGRNIRLDGKEELDFLEKAIADAGGDLFVAGAEVIGQQAEKLKALREKTSDYMDKIRNEIDEISGPIREQTDRSIQGILGDIAAVNEKRMGSAEMNRIMGTALKKAEEEIQGLAEAGKRQIENATKKQKQLLDELAGVLGYAARGY